tara:strand:- start:264050 stop:266011 length:1962 start_codon:yes stop_codon:yes gene_type:complete
MIDRYARIGLLLLLAFLGGPVQSASPLTMLVMDPRALPLSCACVDGIGQRRYETFADRLSQELNREIKLVYEESLHLALRRVDHIDMVIGKRSTVVHDAQDTGLTFHPVASLTDQDGSCTVGGVVLARPNASITSIGDLQGKRVAIGPAEHAECHAAAKDVLRSIELESLTTYDSIESSIYAFDDGEVDAVVVSDFLPPLLVGCGKLGHDSFRKIGVTNDTRFVQAFVSDNMGAADRQRIASTMIRVSRDPDVRRLIESESGFVNNGWTDWRGKNRDGQCENLPKSLSASPQVLWRATVTGPAMAGISATESVVVVADKDAEATEDIFRAFDAMTGQPLWTIQYAAKGKMDYTDSPRATPVIVDNHVILQGAMGDLICATVDQGTILWRKHMLKDFGGELPSWGYCVPPLVIDDKVIIAPGGKQNSVMAIDLVSGETIWTAAGHAAAYAPMIHAKIGATTQIIGYDSARLFGFDAETGRQLWELIPPDNTDFHVGTPVLVNEVLILATENNATRVYEFDETGALVADPINTNQDCAPDTCTPVVHHERVFCSAYGELFCLDASKGYETLWSQADERFYDHTNLIAGNGRVLLWSSGCDLMLLDAEADEFSVLASIRPINHNKAESMSHPAIVDDRIYLRSQHELICLRLHIEP